MSVNDVLVLAEATPDAIATISHELLGAARQLSASSGGDVVALLLGHDIARCGAELNAADRIIAIEDPLLAHFTPAPYLAVLQSVVSSEQPRAVLIGTTTVGLDVAPLLASRLQAPLLKNCQQLSLTESDLLATCNLCGGKLLSNVTVTRSPAVVLVLPGAFHPADGPGRGQLQVQPVPVSLDEGAIRFEEMICPAAGDVDITQEECLVAIGRGIQNQDNIELAEELAAALGGQVAGSRPVIDQGWLPVTRQVGKSGMIVKPKLYLALGISGAPEHQEGMKDAELIIAVNTDRGAPIFDIAHYGTDLDLLDVLPVLTEAVKAAHGVA